jgi:hypothetical protein
VNRHRALDVVQVTTRACRGYGIASVSGGAFAAGAAHLRVLGTLPLGAIASGAVYFDDADAVRTLPDGEYTGNAPDEITLAAAPERTSIRTSGTWRNPGVRYHIAAASDLVVDGPDAPLLTIAPGTVLAFADASGLIVGMDTRAAIVADGLADASRIAFVRAASAPASPLGTWRGILLGPHFDVARTRLRFARIADAARTSGERACGIAANGADAALLRIAARPSAETVRNVEFVWAPANDIAIARDWRGESVDLAAPSAGNGFSSAVFACRQTPVRDSRGRCPARARCD